MKIHLTAINSSYYQSSIAVRSLATVLEDNGNDVYISEFSLKDRYDIMLSQLYATDSSVYAFSVYIWNRSEMLRLACDIKKLKPNALVIFGGPEVSFEDESFFKDHPYVDTILCGEGEEVICKAVSTPFIYKNRILHGCEYADFETSGILYDRYPTQSSILYYESSRGCPYRCSYCLSSLTNGVRAKSAEKTIADIKAFENLKNKPQIIKFVDRTFNYDVKRAKTIWRELTKSDYSLSYHFEISADLLDEECFEILRAMPKGRIQIEAGVQSTNHATLEAINRTNRSKKIIENIGRIHSYGNIHVHADLIVGLPYEDNSSLRRSFNETIGCCDMLQLGFLKMLRGSKIRKEADAHGYVFESKEPYTVLKNNYLSFEEISFLKQVADLLDRIYSSNRFCNTMEYIINNNASPFDFFCELTSYLGKDVRSVSQHKLIEYIYSYLEKLCATNEAFERLCLDVLINENKSLPEYLDKHTSKLENELVKDIVTKNEHTYSKTLNGYKFGFDAAHYYIINRDKHSVIKIQR